MKFNFTKIGILIFLFFGLQNLSAQDPNVLTITAPDEVVGDYTISIPDWGGTVTTFNGGTATFAEDATAPTTDACEEVINNLAGKWAFIDRGSCEFGRKALNAQEAGAVLVIVCNNDTDNPSVQPNMGAGADGAQVTIPVVGINYQDCLRIRVAAIGANVGAQIRYQCGTNSYPPGTVWGDQGEGEFDGGLGDWEIENDCNLGFEYTATRARFLYDNNLGSACNGFVAFPSRNQAEIAGAGGTEPTDPREGVFCDGRLTSPNIDLSGDNVDGLFCEFWHSSFYFFGGYTQLAVSFDNGATYPDTIAVTTASGTGGNPNPPAVEPGCQLITVPVNDMTMDYHRIPITGYTGQGQITLQFMHSGGFYEATIDDVILTSGGQYVDIEVGQTYKTSAPAYRIPLSQAQPVPFHADIINLGNVSAPNPELMAEVELNNNIVWSATNSQFGEAPPVSCFLNENLSFEEMYTPTEEGVYTMITTNITADDRFPENDVTTNTFEITKDIWSTASATATRNQMWSGLVGDTPFANFWPGYDWAIAYPFYIPNGTDNFLNTVTFGVAPLATNSGSIAAYVYKWVPGLSSFPNGNSGVNIDGVRDGFDWSIHPDETTLVGICSNVFDQQRTTVPLNAGLIDDPDFNFDFENITMNIGQADRATGELVTDNAGTPLPLELEDNSYYVIVFAITPSDDAEIDFLSVDGRDGSEYYQGATNYAYAYNSSVIRSGPMTATLDNDGDFELDIENLLFSTHHPNNIPWLEMNIGELLSNTEELTEAAAQSISIFPNPVTDQINVEINLDETSDVVSFELMDINGKTIKTSRFTDIKTAELTMGVKDVTPGVYTLNVRSEAGFTAKKVIVQR